MKASSEAFSKTRREELALGPTGRRPKTGCRTAKITVTIRKKPILEEGKSDTLQVISKNSVILNELRKELSGLPQTTPHEFEFDRIYDENCTNLQIYRSCVQSLVKELFLTEGTRCSCFAFGQTGSGKTYTMMGNLKLKGMSGNPAADHGLYEWASKDLIEWINKPEYKEFGLQVSFFEIHCNKAYDLLQDNRPEVKPLDSANGEGVIVKGLATMPITSEKDLLTVIHKGLSQRSTAANSRNNESSRSHALLTIDVKHSATGATRGKIAFIDLAGSERGADTGAFGRTTQTDGAGINKSLLALKECIRAMDQGKTHIPFRDSQLTKVLRDFFIAPQGLCVMIATAASTSDCCEQTLNTLRYAQRFIAVRKNAVPCIIEDEDNDPEFSLSTKAGGLARLHSPLESEDDEEESFSDAKGFASSGESSERAPGGGSHRPHHEAAPDEGSDSDKSSLLCSEEAGSGTGGLNIPRSLLSRLSKRSPGSPPLEELLSRELHHRLRKVIPKCDRSKLIKNHLTNQSPQGFEAVYQQHTKTAWARYSDLQEVQRTALNDISTLALAQVRLAMEDDVERPSIPSGGSKTAAKLMALNQEKLKFSRLVIEQQMSRLLHLSDVLNEAEIALKNHQLLEREAQKRSMEAVQYYTRNNAELKK